MGLPTAVPPRASKARSSRKHQPLVKSFGHSRSVTIAEPGRGSKSNALPFSTVTQHQEDPTACVIRLEPGDGVSRNDLSAVDISKGHVTGRERDTSTREPHAHEEAAGEPHQQTWHGNNQPKWREGPRIWVRQKSSASGKEAKGAYAHHDCANDRANRLTHHDTALAVVSALRCNRPSHAADSASGPQARPIVQGMY